MDVFVTFLPQKLFNPIHQITVSMGMFECQVQINHTTSTVTMLFSKNNNMMYRIDKKELEEKTEDMFRDEPIENRKQQ